MKIVALRDVAASCVGGHLRIGKDGEENKIITVYANRSGRRGPQIVIVTRGHREHAFDFFVQCIQLDDGSYVGEDDAFHLVPPER